MECTSNHQFQAITAPQKGLDRITSAFVLKKDYLWKPANLQLLSLGLYFLFSPACSIVNILFFFGWNIFSLHLSNNLSLRCQIKVSALDCVHPCLHLWNVKTFSAPHQSTLIQSCKIAHSALSYRADAAARYGKLHEGWKKRKYTIIKYNMCTRGKLQNKLDVFHRSNTQYTWNMQYSLCICQKYDYI